jgi:hypothetical protein
MTRSRIRLRCQRIVGSLGLVLVGAAFVSILPGTIGTAAAATKPADPATNVAVAVPYTAACYSSHAAATGTACQRALVADIDAGRAREHLRPLVLPRGYAALSAQEQVFVVTNLERVARNLTPLAGLSSTLDARAAQGAAANADPTIAGWNLGSLQGQVWTSVQATVSNPLEADWLWMYSDGWGGTRATTNVDCTGPHSSGCWGHRDNILAGYAGTTTLVAGTAAVSQGAFVSYAELVLGGSGATPALHYTWKQALAAGADRH